VLLSPLHFPISQQDQQPSQIKTAPKSGLRTLLTLIYRRTGNLRAV